MIAFNLKSRVNNSRCHEQECVRVVPIMGHSIWLMAMVILVCSLKLSPLSYAAPMVSFLSFCQPGNVKGDRPTKIARPNGRISLEESGDLVSITQLLSDPTRYHRQIIKVRGTVTQPELHVDESGLFIRFVFVLKDAENTLIVFGHHDRTQGNIEIETNEMVEVMGIFWKDRTANDHHFRNNLEAITVTRYPPLHPRAA